VGRQKGTGRRIAKVTSQKTVAKVADRTEARGAMTNTARLPNRGHAFVTAFLSVAFLWSLALAASPELHARVHKDANRAGHNCAVTLIASGNFDHSSHPPLVTAPNQAVQLSKPSAMNPIWVESLFLLARIFEHAPPALA
jgi:hypothetical protein